MTVENCLRLLKVYQERIDTADTVGRDSAEREYIKKNSKKALANMKAHILNSVKRKGIRSKWHKHPILEELQGKKEEKKDGKKPEG